MIKTLGRVCGRRAAGVSMAAFWCVLALARAAHGGQAQEASIIGQVTDESGERSAWQAVEKFRFASEFWSQIPGFVIAVRKPDGAIGHSA